MVDNCSSLLIFFFSPVSLCFFFSDSLIPKFLSLFLYSFQIPAQSKCIAKQKNKHTHTSPTLPLSVFYFKISLSVRINDSNCASLIVLWRVPSSLQSSCRDAILIGKRCAYCTRHVSSRTFQYLSFFHATWVGCTVTLVVGGIYLCEQSSEL